MKIKQVLAELEKLPIGLQLKNGFCNPHSYRGYNDILSFEPAMNRSLCVVEVLEIVKGSLGKTFGGWKGGEYLMTDQSDVVFAFKGQLAVTKIAEIYKPKHRTRELLLKENEIRFYKFILNSCPGEVYEEMVKEELEKVKSYYNNFLLKL